MKNKNMQTIANKSDLLKFAREQQGKREVTSMKDVHAFIGRGGSTQFKKVVNGEQITYGDCIHSNHELKFPWHQRILHLFGKKIRIDTEMYVEDETRVIRTIGQGRHYDWFSWLKKQGPTQMEAPIN